VEKLQIVGDHRAEGAHVACVEGSEQLSVLGEDRVVQRRALARSAIARRIAGFCRFSVEGMVDDENIDWALVDSFSAANLWSRP
jgi:hypothetical protein